MCFIEETLPLSVHKYTFCVLHKESQIASKPSALYYIAVLAEKVLHAT